MKAEIIALVNDEDSKRSAWLLLDSIHKHAPSIEPVIYIAVVPELVEKLLMDQNIFWSWPWENTKVDSVTGLKMVPYTTATPYKRVACFLSHYFIWKQVAETNEPCIVLEEDALFTQDLSDFELQQMLNHPGQIIGLNDPRGATRKSGVFYDAVCQSGAATGDLIVHCPRVDNEPVPQGLAGNSAYLIKPDGARKLLELVKEHGAWPNDAIMCRQLMPKMLYVTTKFYTRVQGTRSTTTL